MQSINHHPDLQILLDQLEHPPVVDPLAHPLHQPLVVNLVEELLQVQIHHPLMTRQDMRLSRQDGLMGAASRTEPIAML